MYPKFSNKELLLLKDIQAFHTTEPTLQFKPPRVWFQVLRFFGVYLRSSPVTIPGSNTPELPKPDSGFWVSLVRVETRSSETGSTGESVRDFLVNHQHPS